MSTRPFSPLRSPFLCLDTLLTFLVARVGFFTPPSTLDPPNPRACVNAGTTTASQLSRYPNADIAEPIAKDNELEGKQLQMLIDSHRLDHWITTCKDWAGRVLEREEKEGKDVDERRAVELLKERERERKGPVRVVREMEEDGIEEEGEMVD